MKLRPFLYFTALTLAACTLLMVFGDRPLALFVHQHLGGAVPVFAAFTDAVDATSTAAVQAQVVGLPALYVGLLLGFVVVRWGLRQRWGTHLLVTLLTHLASQGSANVLKVMVHRLRPSVLFETGYSGLGLWAAGPHNDSFPSSHTAFYWSLFLPLAVAFPRYRVPLLVLPGLVGIGRVVLGEHYLSDVWFSVWLVAAFTFLFGLLARPRTSQQLAPAGPHTLA